MSLPESVGVVEEWLEAIVRALSALANPIKAGPMSSYMKDVAPFLGIQAPDRRRAVRSVEGHFPTPTASELAELARRLWLLPEREYQYAACDILARQERILALDFLASTIQPLLIDRPWWDTVDYLGSAVISPVTARTPESVELMWNWCRSDNKWLKRAAIQHQRGRKGSTDIDLLLGMCDMHATDREFFVAKAIGWALRDMTRWFPVEVRDFLSAHPALPTVARREAERGLARIAHSHLP
jgi:3-methyladenine DNA glycosylase AlkD